MSGLIKKWRRDRETCVFQLSTYNVLNLFGFFFKKLSGLSKMY